MDSTPTASPSQPAAPRLRWLRAAAVGAVVGLLLAGGADFANSLVGPNFHEVIPGQVYRCAQPSRQRLERDIARYGIRTVVNLRGPCEEAPWYLDEGRATSGHGVSLEDLSMSAGRMPSTHTVKQLVAVIEQSEPPLLFHCHRGIDRTGLACTMALILKNDVPLDEALRALSPRFAHIPMGRTGNMDRFFALYREWLRDTGHAHSREVFRGWCLEHYCPGECRATFALLDAPNPARIPAGEPFSLTVRCTNTSVKPWRLHPGNSAGVHLHWTLLDDEDRGVSCGRSGLFHAVVPPGGHIDLVVAVDAIREPGQYRLRLDMADEQHGYFFQLGNEPLVWDLEIVP